MQEILAVVVGSGLMGLIVLLGLALMFFIVIWALQRHRKKRERQGASGERTLNNPLYTMSKGTYPQQHLRGKCVLTNVIVSDSAGVTQELENGATENLKLPSASPAPAPSYAAPPAPTIRKDGSVQYDEPILNPKKAPPVAPKPAKQSPSPLNSPHYHTLDSHDSIQYPQSPVKPLLSPLSVPQYHTLEPSDSPLLSPRGSPHTSPHFPTTPSSVGLTASLDRRRSPFTSLERSLPTHTRDFSTLSEHHLMQSLHDDPGYDIIQPPRWEGGASLRMTSMTSSLHSRASSRDTLWDDDPSDHVYQQLTSEGV